MTIYEGIKRFQFFAHGLVSAAFSYKYELFDRRRSSDSWKKKAVHADKHSVCNHDWIKLHSWYNYFVIEIIYSVNHLINDTQIIKLDLTDLVM